MRLLFSTPDAPLYALAPGLTYAILFGAASGCVAALVAVFDLSHSRRDRKYLLEHVAALEAILYHHGLAQPAKIVDASPVQPPAEPPA